MATKDLTIDELTIDGGTQNRVKINEDVVEEYHEILSESNGEWPFPPLDVFHDGSANFVADGFHRFLAANRAKRKDIPCKIHKGTAIDARIFGMTANDRNGLRMSRADKRACVAWLLKNGGKMTQAEIAAKAGVTPRTVRSIVADRNQNAIKWTGKPKVDLGGAAITNSNQKGKISSSTPISGEYQQRAMKKAPDGESLGMECPNCARYGREVDWWDDGACALCLHPAEETVEAPGEDADSERIPEESSSRPPRNGREKPAASDPEAERKQRLFQAQGCLKQWAETIRHMMSDRVGIDAFREAFPGPLGDRTIDAAKGLFEALGAWRKGIK